MFLTILILPESLGAAYKFNKLLLLLVLQYQAKLLELVKQEKYDLKVKIEL